MGDTYGDPAISECALIKIVQKNKLCYNMRERQSKVYIHTDVELARTDACMYIL